MNEKIDLRSLSTCKKNHNCADTFGDLVNEINNTCDDLQNHIKTATVEKACNWILEEQLWLDNEHSNLSTDFYSYSKGDIVFSLELGTLNIGNEIRYQHPCVVLYDGGDWILVAPITQATINKETNEIIIYEPFEIFVDKSKKKQEGYFYFIKPSVIQIDQIRRVSKCRILNKKRLKLRTEIINEIDNVMLEYFLPMKLKLLDKMKALNKSNMITIQIKDNEIEQLKSKLELEHERITILTALLKEKSIDKKVGLDA